MTNIEKGLRLSAQLQMLLNRLPSPVAVINENRNVLWQNDSMTAYRRQCRPASRATTICELLGCRHCGNVSPGARLENQCRRCGLGILIENTFRLRQQHANAHFHLPVSKKRRRQLALSTTCVIGRGAPAVILTVSDETELRSRKHLQAEIKRLTGALQTAGSICHELAQPLMTISGYIQLLLMDTEKGSTRYARLEKINEQALRISAITREIMSIRQRHLAAGDQPSDAAARHRHLTLI